MIKNILKPKNFNKIIEILKKHSFQEAEENKFLTLRQIKQNKFFIDCKCISLTPAGQYLFGTAIYEIIDNLKHYEKIKIDAVAGFSIDNYPLTTATAFYSNYYSHINALFIVNKKIEGFTKEIKNVALIESVMTTGRNTLKAIHVLEKAKINVPIVICLVDKQENGKKYIESQTNSKLISICELTDLRSDIIKLSSNNNTY